MESWRYRIVSIEEARERTGLEPDDLLAMPGTQMLTRTFADGRCEESIRLPVELAGAGPSARPVPAPAAKRLTNASG